MLNLTKIWYRNNIFSLIWKSTFSNCSWMCKADFGMINSDARENTHRFRVASWDCLTTPEKLFPQCSVYPFAESAVSPVLLFSAFLITAQQSAFQREKMAQRVECTWFEAVRFSRRMHIFPIGSINHPFMIPLKQSICGGSMAKPSNMKSTQIVSIYALY